MKNKEDIEINLRIMKKYFKLKTDTEHKFWEYKLKGKTFKMKWGFVEDYDDRENSLVNQHDCIGIIVDGNFTITGGLKNTEHAEKFLYVTKNIKASYIVNFDTLIHIDGDLFLSNYVYADSFFGYIQCLGELYSPLTISNGQHIEARKIYSDKRIDVSNFSPTQSLYKYGLKDLNEELLENINYQKNYAELNEEKLIKYLKEQKQILRQ